MTQTRLATRLAMADLMAEKILALCSVLALAAVLAPLLILAGLRAGVVQGLREALLEDPRIREITTAANRSFDAALLARIAARPDVAFLAPRTRTLAASLLLEHPDDPGRGTRVELIPTAPADPLLQSPPTATPSATPTATPPGPQPTDAVTLSASAAARLHAAPGDPLVGRLARILDGHRDTVALPLHVAAVAPPAAFPREAAFVALPLAVLVEDFQDGRIPPPTSIAALPPPDRPEYAGFRLYARRLDDVPALEAALQAQGLEVVSRAADVAGLLRVDRNLALLFALVATLGGAGVLVSLGAGLWANVERKRVPLAQLRFLGLRTGAMRVFPIAQAGVLALAGTAVALAAATLAAAVINHLFAGLLALDRPLCRISPALAAAAAALTLAGATIVAAAAGTRAARVQPWEGVSTP